MHERSLAYRAFKEEFVIHMQSGSGFPETSYIKTWFRKTSGGVKAQFLSDAMNGEYAPEKCVAGLIELLIESDRILETQNARVSLLRFLRRRGIDSASLDDHDLVLSHVCTERLRRPPDRKAAGRVLGALLEGMKSVADYSLPFMLKHGVQGCRSDVDEVAECVSWMFERIARTALAEGPRLSTTAAIAAAERYTGISLEDYQRRASIWHGFNPWTVVRARGREGRPAGMSIVLPLTRTAYEEILDGRRRSFDCSPADLVVPSNHLLLEACEENPAYPSDHVAEERRVMGMVLQFSALMRYRVGSSDGIYRWLSFAGTPSTREVLISNGFRATGRKMAGTKIELLERHLDLINGDLRFLEGYVLGKYGEQCPAEPPRLHT